MAASFLLFTADDGDSSSSGEGSDGNDGTSSQGFESEADPGE